MDWWPSPIGCTKSCHVPNLIVTCDSPPHVPKGSSSLVGVSRRIMMPLVRMKTTAVTKKMTKHHRHRRRRHRRHRRPPPHHHSSSSSSSPWSSSSSLFMDALWMIYRCFLDDVPITVQLPFTSDFPLPSLISGWYISLISPFLLVKPLLNINHH